MNKPTEPTMAELEANLRAAMDAVSAPNETMLLNPEQIAELQNEGRVAHSKGLAPTPPSEYTPVAVHEWLHGYYSSLAAADARRQKRRKKPAERVRRAERAGLLPSSEEAQAWAEVQNNKTERLMRRFNKVTSQGNGEHSGGSVNYYTIHVAHPTHQPMPYTVECNDIIEALQMDYAEGNVFKAIWRTAAARQGKLKKGHDAKYDAEKIVFFGQRLVERAKREV